MPRKLKNKLLPVADQIIHAYVNQNANYRQIANFFGVSTGTVRNLLLIKEVQPRPKGRQRKGVI